MPSFLWSINKLLSCCQILLDGEIHITEILFFVLFDCVGNEFPLALVSLFSSPHADMLRVSSNTLCSCEYQGNDALEFVDVKTIQAMVSMVPHTPAVGPQATQRYFLVEKPRFNVALMAGIEEELPDEPDVSDTVDI